MSLSRAPSFNPLFADEDGNFNIDLFFQHFNPRWCEETSPIGVDECPNTASSSSLESDQSPASAQSSYHHLPVQQAASEYSTPQSSSCVSPRPMTDIDMSNFLAFLHHAPFQVQESVSSSKCGAIVKFEIPSTGETIHCVAWQGRLYITSQDVISAVKAIIRGQGMLVDVASRKFEETVYSVLRRYIEGVSCQVEEARSVFLQWMAANGCVRTQKKQKVFFWHEVNVVQLADEIASRLNRAASTPKSSPKVRSPVVKPAKKPQFTLNSRVKKPVSQKLSNFNRSFTSKDGLKRQAKIQTRSYTTSQSRSPSSMNSSPRMHYQDMSPFKMSSPYSDSYQPDLMELESLLYEPIMSDSNSFSHHSYQRDSIQSSDPISFLMGHQGDFDDFAAYLNF